MIMHLDILLIILISTIVFYLTGRTLIVTIKKNIREDDLLFFVFKSTILGILFYVTIFAIYQTKFNSIFAGVILLTILYLLYSRFENKNIPNKIVDILPKTKELILFIALLIVSVVYFIIQTSLFYNYPLNNFPPMDFLFYARVIQNLTQIGVETTSNAISPFVYSKTATPYHYVDLWFSALFCKVFSVKSMEAYVVISTSICSSLLIIGMISIVKSITSNKFLIIIAALAVYVTYFDFSNWLGGFASMTWANMSNPKFMFVGLVFIWSINEYLKNKKYKSYLFVLLLLPIFNILIAPPLYFSLGSIVLFCFLKNKTNTNIILLGSVILSALFIFLFYHFNPSESSLKIEPLSIINKSLHFSFLYKLFDVAKDVFISYAIFWLPLILMIIIQKNEVKQLFKENRQLFFVIILLVLFGLFTWIFLYDLYDSFQFFFLTLLGFSLISIVNLILLYSILRNKLLKRLMLLYIFAICVFFTYNMYQVPGFYIYTSNPNSPEYVEQVMNKISKKNNFNYIGANIKSPIEQQSSRNSYGQLSNYFISNYDEINTVSLNPNTSFGNKNENKIVSYDTDPSPFMDFINTKTEGARLEDIQYEYIIENKIDYLILGKDVQLPPVFSNMVDTVFIDKKSGNRFVFLNY